MKNKITDELKERFGHIIESVSHIARFSESPLTYSDILEAMKQAYQLDRSSLFSRAEVERIAEKVRDATKEAANLDYYDWDRCRISWDDIDLNQIINKR